MVGDRYGRDVVGAHAAGLFTVLLDVHAHPIHPPVHDPTRPSPRSPTVLAVLPLLTHSR